MTNDLEELMKKPKGTNDPVSVRGFFRVQLEDQSGEIVGDSGWHENLVTNLGFNNYLVKLLGSIAGAVYLSHVALGTGGLPATGDTTLAGEVQARTTFTAATSSTSKALNITATFSSSGSFVTATQNISNIGLFNSSSGGSLFAGNTYASSSCATNQNVNVSYVISFS